MTGLCKNPFSNLWIVERPRIEPYGLEELSRWFTVKEMKPWSKREKRTGYGRNCQIFDESGAYARKVVLDWKSRDYGFHDFLEHIDAMAFDINWSGAFAVPLPPGEVAEIARKVASWTWRYFSEDGLRRWHVMKGKAGLRSRWDGHVTAKVKAAELGISESTLYRHRSSPSGLITPSLPDIAILSRVGDIESCQPKVVSAKAEPLSKPWEAEGISPRTWYRRQAKLKAA
jgi:hypothetical protein